MRRLIGVSLLRFQVLQKIWPAQLALFFTGTCGLLIFPFLTYVPSDGMLGDMLPKVRARRVSGCWGFRPSRRHMLPRVRTQRVRGLWGFHIRNRYVALSILRLMGLTL